MAINRDAHVNGCPTCENPNIPVPHFASVYCMSNGQNEANPNGRAHCACNLCY